MNPSIARSIARAKLSPVQIVALRAIIATGAASGAAESIGVAKPVVVLHSLKDLLRVRDGSIAERDRKPGDIGTESHYGSLSTCTWTIVDRAEWIAAIEARIAEIESTPAAPPLPPEFAQVLRWYSGKGQEAARLALDGLAASIKHGSWLPGVSRGAWSALGKANVAQKQLRVAAKQLGDLGLGEGREGWYIGHALEFGLLAHVPGLVAALPKLVAAADVDQEAALLALAPWLHDMRPVAEAMVRLDATRPIPVFSSLGVSRTVTATLKDAALDLNLATLRVCPIEYSVREVTDPKTGKTTYEPVAKLLWPEGTRFNASRFAGDNGHCHACGHSIRNGFNWVPLLIDSAKGVPHALWVGRDCAESVFGIKMTGDLEVTR